MSDSKIQDEEMLTIKAINSPVLLCHPKTKKRYEAGIKIEFPDAYLIEDNCVEPNIVHIVKDLEMKKALIELYEKQNNKEGGAV